MMKLVNFNRSLAIFLLVQILLVVLFLWEYNAPGPLSLEDCEHNYITVEKKYTISRKAHSSGMLHISFNDDIYVFSDSKYSTRELYETISAGESIDVYYVERYDLFSGKFFLVVDARTESNVYIDIELYNKNAQVSNLLTIVCFSVIEVVILAILGFYLFIHSNDIKKIFKKLKKRIEN